MVINDYDSLTDAELVYLFQKEKKDSMFEELYRRYNGMIFNYIKRYMYYLPLESVEELLDDVFIKVYKNIEQLYHVEFFKRWIYQITHNTCIKYIKKKRVYDIPNEKIEEMPDRRVNLEDNYLHQELKSFLMNEVSKFDHKTRELIILKFYQDLTYDEISKIVNMRVHKLKYLMDKALFSLHTKLKIKGYY